MNLLCPNCQKMLQVPEQYAGQLMKCPLCTGTFTVPALPQQPTASPPPPPPPPMAPAETHGKGPQGFTHGGAGSTPVPPAGYAHQRSFTFNPRVLPWVAPLCLLVIFVLLFFSWAGMYPGGIGVVTQSGMNVAFGGITRDNKVWDKNYGPTETDKIIDQVGAGVWLVFYLLVLLPTIILSLGGALVQTKLVPVELPPSLQTYWTLRPIVVTVLNLAALAFFLLQLFTGLPLEKAASAEVDKKVQATKPERMDASDEEKLKIDAGRELGKFNLERTNWLYLALWLQVLALIGSALECWVERRGALPPPRVDLLT